MTQLITKETALELTNEINAAIAAIFEKRGMDTPKVKTSYGAYYKLTIESTPVNLDDNGINLNDEYAQSYTLFARSYGLDEGLLGKTFTVPGKGDYIFLGVAIRRPKYPIVVKNVSDGKTSLFTAHVAKYINNAEAK